MCFVPRFDRDTSADVTSHKNLKNWRIPIDRPTVRSVQRAKGPSGWHPICHCFAGTLMGREK